MTDPVCLSEVPRKFLDRRKWNSLRRSAPQKMIALTYINAPTLTKQIQVISFGTAVARGLRLSAAIGPAGRCCNNAAHF